MHKCTIDGLYGAIQAHAAIDDGPIFNDKNIVDAGFESHPAFAKLMNKFAGKQAEKKATVSIGEYTKDDSVKGTVQRGVNLGRTPEALLPKKVYSKIDKKMEQWDKFYKKSFAPRFRNINAKYDAQIQKARASKASAEQLKALEVKRNNALAPIRKEAEASYRQTIGKQMDAANTQLQDVFNEYAGKPKALDRKLKQMGLTKADAYYTHEYLKYLKNGGPYFNFNAGGGNKGGGDFISERVSTITGKKVSFNPMTAVFNVGELATKAPAVFGFKNTLKGLAEAGKVAKAEGATIFDRLPSLEKKGVYSNDLTPLRPDGKFDPVTRTQNMLDNAAYFIGQSAGDVQKGLKEIAYRPKPWNDTFVYQDPRAKTLIPFMSFQFRHMQQYGGWWRDLTTGTAAQRQQAGKAIVIYSVMNGLIFGDKAAIPAPIYLLFKAADPKLDEDIQKLNGSIPILDKGIIGSATGLDLGKYAQPFGGVAVGIGTDMINNATETTTKTLPKVGKQIREGRYDKAAALTANALVVSSQIFKQGANAAVQKAVDAVTKAYLEDEDLEGYVRTAGQKFFGKDAVPKKETPTGDGLPELPALPELPQVQ